MNDREFAMLFVKTNNMIDYLAELTEHYTFSI